MATRGVTPNWAAVRAEVTAMSASCSGVGLGLTAQSPNAHTRSFIAMRKIEETTETPGAVLMIWKEGTIVCAVVWAAPETMPSASPMWTIMVPK